MSDGINDVEKDSEMLRLSKLDPKKLANNLRQKAQEIERITTDLSKLGYNVDREGNNYRVYKEI